MENKTKGESSTNNWKQKNTREKKTVKKPLSGCKLEREKKKPKTLILNSILFFIVNET